MRAYGWLGSEDGQLSEKGLLATSLQALKNIRSTQEHTSKMQIPRPHLQRDSGSLGLREYLLENLPFSSALADSDAERPRITLWETVTYGSSESWVKDQVFPKLHRQSWSFTLSAPGAFCPYLSGSSYHMFLSQWACELLKDKRSRWFIHVSPGPSTAPDMQWVKPHCWFLHPNLPSLLCSPSK